jgi:hypothetical protein
MHLRKSAHLTAAFLLSLAFHASAAHANGIAFSYAPEQGSGMCMGEDAAQTISCAQQKCAEIAGSIEDCVPMTWCSNAGWSFGAGLMHKEGIHWSEFSCGWPSREAALAATKVFCDLSFREQITACSAGILYDPDGNEIALDE